VVDKRTYTVDENSRLTCLYRGQAHANLGGDWRQHFCQDGYVFCAHGEAGADLERLPDYVSAVTKDGDMDTVQTDTTELHVVHSIQVLEGVQPDEDDRLTSLRRIGRWTSALSRQSYVTGYWSSWAEPNKH
jgi:hypothetical protein